MSKVQHSQHPGPHERAVSSGYELNALPVVPPDATTFKDPGKTPGKREANGAWTYFPSWQKEQETSLAQARDYNPWGAGLGLRAGVKGLVGVDLDILDLGLHRKVKRFFMTFIDPKLRAWFPERGVDHPAHVKSLLLCAAVDPFDNPVSLGSTDIAFEQAGLAQQVQILAAGRYFNAIGTHPDRKAPYIWNVDILDLGLGNLPRIPSEDILAFIRALPAFLETQGCKVTSKGHAREAGAWKQLTARETLPNATVIKAMRTVPNDRSYVPGYEAWISAGMMFRGAAQDPDDPELLDAFVFFSSGWNGTRIRGREQDPAHKWATFAPEYTHAGTLRNWLAHVASHPKPGDPDFTAKEALASEIDKLDLHPSMLTPIEPGAPTFAVSGVEDLFEQLRKARATPTVYANPPSKAGEAFDPNSLSTIEVIPPSVMGYYTRGRTTMLLAVPGAGKSSLMVSTSAALMFERPDLMDEPDAGFPGASVIVSNEDDKAIIAGKLRALMNYHSLDPKLAKHEVRIFNGVKLLSRDPASGAFHLACRSFLLELIELRKRQDIALITFDTLASLTRGIEENSNDQMQVVMEFFTRLAEAAHAAVVVIHHVSKSGLSKDGEIGIYGGRGASSMAADMRSTIQVLKPSPDDREEYKWDALTAKAWVKVLPLKGSYDDPATWAPKWFHFKSVQRPALDIRNPAVPSSRSYGVLVPEEPIAPSPQAMGSFDLQVRHAWGVLDAALTAGRVYNLKTKSSDKVVFKELIKRDKATADALLDELVRWKMVTIKSKWTHEIVRVDGAVLPVEPSESHQNLDQNLDD